MARPLNWDAIRRARLLRAEGKSFQEIADTLGAKSKASVAAWLAVEGDGPPPAEPERKKPRPPVPGGPARTKAPPRRPPAPLELDIQALPKEPDNVIPLRQARPAGDAPRTGKAADSGLVATLLEAIEKGATVQEACAVVGIRPATIKEWRTKAAAGDRAYIDLGDRIEIALQKRRLLWKGKIEELGMARQDWKAFAWLIDHEDGAVSGAKPGAAAPADDTPLKAAIAAAAARRAAQREAAAQ